MENTANFRTSLHGFHREDVISFIERTALEHEKELRVLKDANERLLAEQREAASAAALEAELAAAKAENAKLKEQLAAAKARSGELEEALTQAKAAAVQAAAPSTAATPLNAPIPAVSEVLPAPPTASSKNYSELELAAYRRAEVAERLARERAAKVYEQISSVFSTAAARFDENGSDLDQLIKALQMNVEQLQQILCTIRSSYTEAGESFKALGERNMDYEKENL